MTPAPTPPTAIQIFEYKRAFNYSKRRETRKPDGSVRQRAGSLAFLHMKSPARIVCSLSASCPAPTASWKWVPTTGKEHHRIEINPKCSETFLDDLKNTSSRRIALAKSVFAHEVCHALYTSRDTGVAARCQEVEIPFRLLNLMEDCRIEWRYIKERGKEERFRWRSFDDKMRKMGETIDSPVDWLYTMKAREPALFKDISSVMVGFKWGGGEGRRRMPVVSYTHPMKAREGSYILTPATVNLFYRHIVEAPTTEDLIPLAQYWVDTFGREAASSLPPIIIDTVPSSIGGVEDPSSASPAPPDDADRGARGIDHSAVPELRGVTVAGRGVIETERVMHHNTRDFLYGKPITGFTTLSKYTNH